MIPASPADIERLCQLALERGGTVSGGTPPDAAVCRDVPQPAGVRPKGQQKPTGGMNKLEEAYARHLESLKQAGEILEWWREPWKFRLADRTYYSPDFVVMLPSGLLAVHETKGWMRDDAAVKLKVTASLYWMFPVYLVKKIKGGWDVKLVSAN